MAKERLCRVHCSWGYKKRRVNRILKNCMYVMYSYVRDRNAIVKCHTLNCICWKSQQFSNGVKQLLEGIHAKKFAHCLCRCLYVTPCVCSRTRDNYQTPKTCMYVYTHTNTHTPDAFISSIQIIAMLDWNRRFSGFSLAENFCHFRTWTNFRMVLIVIISEK